ncbi:MAG: hypothetical protein FWD65_02000 [Coriobacteriia bacterium]|nr:hypothetical protein [Coriobacteriia bacterium]
MKKRAQHQPESSSGQTSQDSSSVRSSQGPPPACVTGDLPAACPPRPPRSPQDPPDHRPRARVPKRSTLAVLAALILLAALVATLATLNARRQAAVNAGAGAGAPSDAFRLTTSTETTLVTRATLQRFSPRPVTVTLDTSTTSRRRVTYTGLPLGELFRDLGVPFSSDNYCVANASDGFTMSYLADEVARGDVWLVYESDGAALPGRAQGGFGPYLIVTQNAQFSLRWCKYLQELTVK